MALQYVICLDVLTHPGDFTRWRIMPTQVEPLSPLGSWSPTAINFDVVLKVPSSLLFVVAEAQDAIAVCAAVFAGGDDNLLLQQNDGVGTMADLQVCRLILRYVKWVWQGGGPHLRSLQGER